MKTTTKVIRSPRNALSKPIPIRLLPEEIRKTNQFAEQEMSSRSRFIRVTYLRGLAAYENDLIEA